MGRPDCLPSPGAPGASGMCCIVSWVSYHLHMVEKVNGRSGVGPKVGMGGFWAGAWGQGLEGGHQGVGGGLTGQGVAGSEEKTGQWVTGWAKMVAQCAGCLPAAAPTATLPMASVLPSFVVVQHSQPHLHLLGWAGEEEEHMKVG